MKLENLIEELNNTDLNVIEIDGKWGVGKTYFLNEFVKNQKGVIELNSIKNEKIRKNTFEILNISSSAIKSANLKKILLFEKRKFEGSKKLVAQVTQKTSEALANAELKGLGKIAGDVGEFFLNKSIEDEDNNNLVVIIDEIERFASNIDFKSFLISIFELKESFKNIKIILSLNSDKLEDKEKNIWNLWNDKIIDRKINFKGNESFDYCLNKTNEDLNNLLGTNIKIKGEYFNNNIRNLKKAKILIINKFKPLKLKSDLFSFRNDYIQYIADKVCVSIVSSNVSDFIYIEYNFLYQNSKNEKLPIEAERMTAINTLGFNYENKRLEHKNRNDNLKSLKEELKKNEGTFISKKTFEEILYKYFKNEEMNKKDNESKDLIKKKIDDSIINTIKRNIEIPFIENNNLYFRKDIQDKYDISISLLNKMDEKTNISYIKGSKKSDEYFQFINNNIALVNFGQITNEASLNFNFIDIIFSMNNLSDIEKKLYLNHFLIKKVKSLKDEIYNISKDFNNDIEKKMYIDEIFNLIEQIDLIKRFCSIPPTIFKTDMKIFKNSEIKKLFKEKNYTGLKILKKEQKEEIIKEIDAIKKLISIDFLMSHINCSSFYDFTKIIINDKDMDLFAKIYNYFEGTYKEEKIVNILAKIYSYNIKKEKEKELDIEREINQFIESSIYNPNWNKIKEEGIGMLNGYLIDEINQEGIEKEYLYKKTRFGTLKYMHIAYLGKYSEDFKDFKDLIKKRI